MVFRLPLCLERFVDRVVRLTDVQNQSFRNVSHFYSFIRAGTEDDVSQLRRARQQTRGKKNARSDGAPGSRGIPQCQEDSCGTPGVTQSARIFLDKIFLTERAVVFAQRAVACSTQDIRPCASFSSPFSIGYSILIFLQFLDYAASTGEPCTENANLPRERNSNPMNLSPSIWYCFHLILILLANTRFICFSFIKKYSSIESVYRTCLIILTPLCYKQ